MSLRKFEILEMIAKGGMAEVYRAKTVGLEGFAKEVCVKKILPHLTEDENFITMFINEAKLAATLNYGNIVSVHDLCVSADHEYFIVMEYVSGKDVSDVIRAAQLAGAEIPPEIAVYVGREVAKGLYYAHNKTDADNAPLNIIHRDISPQNILCSFMGEVKITDFGIAKASSIMSKTAVGILKGKYGYMSPEQARGQPLDHRSDVFNLGIVLYEMLVGERCFAGASDYSTLNLMREAVVTPPRKINAAVPSGLEEIVLKALARSTRDRFQDALELEGALADYDKKADKSASPSDLGRYMKSLFSGDGEGDERRGSTGVLNLSSVVGPAPEAGEQKAEAEPKPSPDGSKIGAPPPSKAASGVATPKDEPAPKSKAKSSPPPKSAVLEAPKSAAKSKRKPARLKDGPTAAKRAKADAKAKAKAERKPVGRKHLKPGLTDLSALSASSISKKLALVAAVLIVAAGAGWMLGQARTEAQSQQGVFRAAEIAEAELEPGAKPRMAVVIDTTPSGATVWLDRSRLAEVTPLSVERPRDTEAHEVELALPGYETLERTFRYESDNVTLIRETLKGDTGALGVRSTPSGLRVEIDGLDMGRTPLKVDVPWGMRKVSIGDVGTETVVANIAIEPGGSHTIERTVPKRGERTTLAIISEPAAEIIVDGKATGKHTNDGALDLAPGLLHEITLVTPGMRKAVQIRLEAGERRQLFLDL